MGAGCARRRPPPRGRRVRYLAFVAFVCVALWSIDWWFPAVYAGWTWCIETVARIRDEYEYGGVVLFVLAVIAVRWGWAAARADRDAALRNDPDEATDDERDRQR